MYIIKTISKSKKDSTKKYYTFRLMESQRIGDKVKKITLLNLGSDFSINQEHWANFSKRIDDIINRTPSLFEFDKDLESLACIFHNIRPPVSQKPSTLVSPKTSIRNYTIF